MEWAFLHQKLINIHALSIGTIFIVETSFLLYDH